MKQFLTFISIGIFDTLLDISIFTTLISVFGTQPINIIIFNPFSYSIAIVCSFFLNGKFTFKDEHLSLKKFYKLYASSTFGMILNTSIVYVLITLIGSNTVLSKIFASCIVVFYNYAMCKNYIFRSPT